MPRTTTTSPRRRSREDWRELLMEQRRSGLPMDRFANARSLSPRSLRWWAWKLRDELGAPAVEIIPTTAKAAEPIEVVVGDVRVLFTEPDLAVIAAFVRELRTPC